MARCIMVQGTMSGAGKSLLAAALCRIFRQDGWRAAPFKGQNMALNSYITRDGLEMGRAQAVQAQAAGIEPDVRMNPVLLKPSSDTGSQLIVLGEVRGQYEAAGYFRMKKSLIPEVLGAYESLAAQYDVIVIEGAGSPAEINLRDGDSFVNMGLAKLVNAPVLLVGDIDRGGVFASLYGTVALLEPEERAMIRGLVINKFRGDRALLDPGLKMIEDRLGIPVLGVVPMGDIDLDDEDSLSGRLAPKGRGDTEGVLDIAVVRLPHISNFTDFHGLERNQNVCLRYVDRPGQLGRPDLAVLPGTKNTMADLAWMREKGLEQALKGLVEEKAMPLIGICGGYQMLGQWLQDPFGAEGPPGKTMQGMGLLPAKTVFSLHKTRTQITGELAAESRMFAKGAGEKVSGYEIHMGETTARTGGGSGTAAKTAFALADGRPDGLEREDGLVFGTYLHGLFDNEKLTRGLLGRLAEQKGVSLKGGQEEGADAYRERQYDRLADLVRRSLDMERVYAILE